MLGWVLALVYGVRAFETPFLPLPSFTNPSRLAVHRPSALDRLGLDDVFFSNSFQRQVFHGHAGVQLDISMERVLNTTTPQDLARVDIRTDDDKSKTNPSSLQQLQELLHNNQNSLVFHTEEGGALELSETVSRLKKELENLFQAPMTANLYVSGAHASALPPHTDTTDTIIIQEQGRKAWIFCVPKPAMAVGTQLLSNADLAEIQEARIGRLKGCSNYGLEEILQVMSCSNLTMIPGDVLYIPKGIVHMARESDGATSIHLTLGLVREGFSFRSLLQRALSTTQIDKKEGVPLFGDETMSWVSILEKAFKYLENSDAGISVRRTVPMWLLGRAAEDVFEYYKRLLVELQFAVFQVLKGISNRTMVPHPELEYFVQSMVHLLEQRETFEAASSALLQSPPGRTENKECTTPVTSPINDEAPFTSRHLLTHNTVCLNSCTSNYDGCIGTCGQKNCGCTSDCDDGCTDNCNDSCDDDCGKCDGDQPCGYYPFGPCTRSCNRECKKGCDTCNSGCTTSCDRVCNEWCNSDCSNRCTDTRSDCERNCALCPTSVNFTQPGNVTYSNTNKYQSIAMFSCLEGFTLSTSSTRQCQSNEQWSNSNPTCQPRTCNPPPVVANSMYTPTTGLIYKLAGYNGATSATIITWSCISGYALKGPLTSACLSNLSWTPPPLCTDIDECIASTGNPCIGGTCTNTNGGFTCACPLGYVLSGLKCVGQNCQPLTAPMTGATLTFNQTSWINYTTEVSTTTSVPYAMGAYTCPYKCSAQLTCPTGYLSDPSVAAGLTCDPPAQQYGFASWNQVTKNQTLECVGLPCPYIAQNGPISFGDVNWPVVNGRVKAILRYLDQVEIACDLGYIPLGSARWDCGVSGSVAVWNCRASNGTTVACTTPTCIGRPCASIPPVTNGNAAVTGYIYPANITYTCSPGYYNNGTDGTVGYCDAASGQWKGGVPYCLGKVCGPPRPGTNASVPTYDNLGVFPTVATYGCPKDFYSGTAMTRACDTNGKWPVGPTCYFRIIQTVSMISSTIAPSPITISGTFGNGTSPVVTFGPYGRTGLFNCTSTTMTPTTISCVAPAGVGANYYMVVASREFSNTLYLPKNGVNYSQPVILNVWGRTQSGLDLVNATNFLKSDTRFGGDFITISGRHFGTDPSRITVLYGLRYACSSITNLTCGLLNCTLVCTTARGAGALLQFRLGAGVSAETMQFSVPSVATFSYPDGPSVTKVTGCTQSITQSAATSFCPTKGGLEVSLTGKVFIDPAFNTSVPIVTIGSSTCPVKSFNSTFITCMLSSGTGFDQTVAVMVGDLSGDAQPLLSFAPATVFNITGCTNRARCKRIGGDVITVNGKDFGPKDAKVIIGGQLCAGVTHVNYNQLTCTMSLGEGLSQLVSVLQYDGQYTTTNWTLSYEVCGAGTFDESVNTTICANCAPGKYTDLTDRQFCDVCPLGRYQPNAGQSSCIQAQYGEFVNDTGLKVVYNCSPGSYSPGLEGQSCSLCEAGRSSARARAQGCTLCAPGRFQNTPGQTDCSNCLPGTYQSTSGMVICNPCPTGTVAPSQGSPSATNCLPGTAAVNATQPCAPCVQGRYTDRALSSSCDLCGPGKFSSGSGLSYCTTCSPGKYQDLYEKTGCILCPAGKFQQALAASICDKCAPGSYSNSSSATSCYPCSVGNFAAVQGLTVCTLCGSGTYARDIRQSGCLNCDPGTYSNTQGNSVCTNCLPGRAAAGFGSTDCPECLAGTANPALGQPLCLSCDFGTAAGSKGAISCDVCIPGQFAGAIASTICDSCVAGRFSAGNRSSACDPCPAGAVSSIIGATGCSVCSPGRVAPASGATNCTACPLGEASALPGSIACSPCIPGSFSNISAATQCKDCIAGRISPSQRGTICKDCELGRFSQSIASTACLYCVLGTAGNITGATGCKDCVPGRFTPQSGLTFCHECERGFFSSTNRATVCTSCAVGTFVNISAQTECSTCDSGTYQGLTGATYCNECRLGYFLGSPGGSACVQCPVGKFTNQTATTLCGECVKGYYADQPASAECFACPPGKRNNAVGQSLCQPCNLGTYNPSSAQTGCLSCAAGRYASQSGLVNCSICSPGTFAEGIANENCSPCLAGSFGNTTGASSCTSCVAGTFSGVPSSRVCTDCDPGTYSGKSGSTFCEICNRGEYQDQSQATVCLGCDPGSFGSNKRMALCQLCPAGKFIHLPYSIECLSCVEGKYTNVTGSIDCTFCPPGSYSASIGTASCILCALGQYNDKSGALNCQACDLGQYAASLGTATCSKCPIGTYQNTRGASLCIDCIPGKFAEGGYSACSECQPQTANPWFGMGKCYRCVDEAHTSENGDLCICPAGTFAPDRDPNMTIFDCVRCNQGFDCTEEGVKFATLAVKAGWWRPDELQLTASPCIILAHCAGGHNSTCGPNRDGVLCAFCEEGYTASGTGKTGKCTGCPESKSGSYAVIVLGSLGALVALMLIYYIVLISDRDVVASFWRKRVRDLGLGDSSAVDSSTGGKLSVVNRESSVSDLSRSSGSISEDDSMSALDTKKQKKNAVTAGASGAETRIKPNVVYKMKIVAGFLQILTNLTLSVTMPWPTHFRDFMLIFNFLNFDFLPWGTVGCVASLEYIDKIVIICMLPFFALVLGGIAIAFLYKYAKGPERPIMLQVGKYRVIKLFAWTLFLLYPFLCATILKYYVCRRIDDEIFLEADFAVHCYSEKWFKSLPIAVIATLVYPVGIPVVFALFLYVNRLNLDHLDMRLRFGFLVDAYHRSTWWFEIVWSLNKMFCVSLVAFFPITIQIQAAMVWLAGFVIFLLLSRPYIRKGEDRLALLCMLEIILLLMFCLVLVQYNGLIDSATDWVMSIGMILMVCATLLVGLVIAIKNVYKIVRRWKFAWKRSKGRTNKPTLGAPVSSLVQERLDKNSTVLEGRLPNSTGTASNTFEKDLAKFNFSAW